MEKLDYSPSSMAAERKGKVNLFLEAIASILCIDTSVPYMVDDHYLIAPLREQKETDTLEDWKDICRKDDGDRTGHPHQDSFDQGPVSTVIEVLARQLYRVTGHEKNDYCEGLIEEALRMIKAKFPDPKEYSKYLVDCCGEDVSCCLDRLEKRIANA